MICVSRTLFICGKSGARTYALSSRGKKPPAPGRRSPRGPDCRADGNKRPGQKIRKAEKLCAKSVLHEGQKIIKNVRGGLFKSPPEHFLRPACRTGIIGGKEGSDNFVIIVGAGEPLRGYRRPFPAAKGTFLRDGRAVKKSSHGGAAFRAVGHRGGLAPGLPFL